MDNLTGSMKDVAFATSPREFDLSYSTTLEEIMEKLNARRAAFQMPFQIKGGVAGQRIVFEKEPNLDVTLWLYLSNGTHIRIQPVISEAKASVGGVRVDKNSALRKGVKGATIGLATDRGGYIAAALSASCHNIRSVRQGYNQFLGRHDIDKADRHADDELRVDFSLLNQLVQTHQRGRCIPNCKNTVFSHSCRLVHAGNRTGGPGRCRFLRDILVRHKTVDLTAQRRKRALVDAGFSHIRISHDARPIFQGF